MHLSADQERICVYNSLLSEAAVLGFDYGYSLDYPNMLCLWEAQFGDFANGAQTIIDQFIVSAESKWQRPSGIVLLLPHGYEGQGPEHSSGRLERFLQLCAEDNIQVCNLTTAAQYFHVLRRQMKRDFIKPLIIMTPKSLLRAEFASSKAEEFTSGRFEEILPGPEVGDARKTDRIIFCSGKVYYDLLNYRTSQKIENVALIRIEQLYPLATTKLRASSPHSRIRQNWCGARKNRKTWARGLSSSRVSASSSEERLLMPAATPVRVRPSVPWPCTSASNRNSYKKPSRSERQQTVRALRVLVLHSRWCSRSN